MTERKTCNVCNIEQPISEFQKNGTQPSGKQKHKPFCKTCSSKQEFYQYYTRLTQAITELNRQWECELCGYDENLGAIAFHHIEPSTKSFEISKRRHATVETFKGELEKCAILCQNCHAEVHSPRLIKKKVFEELQIPL